MTHPLQKPQYETEIIDIYEDEPPSFTYVPASGANSYDPDEDGAMILTSTPSGLNSDSLDMDDEVLTMESNGQTPIDDPFFMQKNVPDKNGPNEKPHKHCYGSGTGVKKAQIMIHVALCCQSFQGRELDPYDQVSTAVPMDDEPPGTYLLCELRPRRPYVVDYMTCLAALSSFARDQYCGKDKHENFKGGYAWIPDIGIDVRVDPTDPNTGR